MRLVLLDIEGTTTPIAFVHDVLFAFARGRLATWFEARSSSPESAATIRALAAERGRETAAEIGPPPWLAATPALERASAVAYCQWLMDHDRKSPALKTLQGLIWETGYQAGELRGVVYGDVPPAMRRWQAQGLSIAIYSSGSALAQRRLFESTAFGDLTPLIAGFFDTAVGAKVEPASYQRILAAVSCDAEEVLFVSDVTRELAAASAVGCQTRLCLRPGNVPQPDAARYEAVSTFDEILPAAAGRLEPR